MSTEQKSSESKPKGLGRIFRKSKAEAGEGGTVRKAKSFKRIRGFLTGESRKERRARKEAERKARNASAPSVPEPGDDESTIYGVDVDERSIATAGATGTSPTKMLGGGADEVTDDNLFAGTGGTKPYMLKVVLLLMDPETRRFELLQLEFDSKKALVSDVLAQIPMSVTEDALRKQNYTGICGREGKEMTPQELLATFCTGNDVLVAIPQGLPAKECARLAKPILSDEKVVNMVRLSVISFALAFLRHLKLTLSHCSFSQAVLMPSHGRRSPRKGRKRLPAQRARRRPNRLKKRSLPSSLLSY